MPAERPPSGQATDTLPLDAPSNDDAEHHPAAIASAADDRALHHLLPDQQRAIAQEMARAEPDLTGTALAARFGRQQRWGRKQLAAARNNGPAHAAHTPARPGSTPARTSGGTAHTDRPLARHADAPAPANSGTNATSSMASTGGGSRHADPAPARHTGTAAPTDNGTDRNPTSGTMTTHASRGTAAVRTGGTSNGSTTTKSNSGTAIGTPTSRHGSGIATRIERHGGTTDTGTGHHDGAAATEPAQDGPADQAPPVPRSLIIVTVVAVAIVAVVTMVTSYTHTHDLAVVAGWGWLAGILPAAVDGLVIAGSTSLMVDRRLRGQSYRGHPLAWAAVAIGLVSSMAANVVAVDPTLVDMRVVRWVMAGYAPLALALSGHLLLRMLGDQP